MPVAIIPLHPPRSSIFLSLSLLFCHAVEVSCRSGHVARPDSNSLFRAQRRWADRRQRETAHEILRDTEIYARARSSSFDQGPRKSPVPVPRGEMDRERGRCNVISFQYPLSADRTSARIFAPSLAPRAISIPYLLALFRFSTIRSYLMYDTPLRRRPNGTNARLVFGTDHSPLSLRICLCPGTSRRKRIRGPYSLHRPSDTYSCRA